MSELDKDPAKGSVTTEEVDNRIAKAVESLKAKHGSADVALFKLVDENYGYRDKLRDVSAKIPADGAIVLTGDDAKAWGGYRELGALTDVRKAVSERDHLKTRVERYDRDALADEAAALNGFKAGPEFRLLVADLPLEVADAKVDGKPARVARIKGATDADEPTPLADYLKAHRPALSEALKDASKAERRPGTPPPNNFHQPPPRPAKGAEDDQFRDLPYQYAPPAM